MYRQHERSSNKSENSRITSRTNKSMLFRRDTHLNCEEHQKISERKSCANAAASGSLSNLKILREKGYDWDESTCISAALEGHYHILMWACRNGCPMSATTFVATVASLKTPDLLILNWLKIRSCPWDTRVLRMARKRDRDDIIEWLIKNDYPLEWFDEDNE